MWERQFGCDPKVLGRTITLDGSPFTVVGVLPRSFVFPGPDPVQVITPLGKDEAAELQHKVGSIIFNVIGRLKPNVTPEQCKNRAHVDPVATTSASFSSHDLSQNAALARLSVR